MKRTNTILYLVVPCYNEEEVLHKSAAVLLDKLDRLIQAGTISDKSKILFINDGSKDSTWQIIYELTRQNSKYAGLSFSRNFGHQSAIDVYKRQLQGQEKPLCPGGRMDDF